jgi:eukaryotic-like serine/threonine-protein kinase
MNNYIYTPPEQLAGRATLASDLYALGITLVGMASPLPLSDMPRRGQRMLFDQVTNLSPEFTAWLKRLTEPDQPFRFPTVRIALDALDKLPHL